jgi:hypothetical protein
MAGIRQYSGQFWPKSSFLTFGDGGQILATGCCWAPAPAGFRRPTIAEF